MDKVDAGVRTVPESKKYNDYVNILGEPPRIIELNRDPAFLYGFQEDLIALAKGDKPVQTLPSILKGLRQNNVDIIEDDEFLLNRGSKETCEIVYLKSDPTQNKFKLRVGSTNFYSNFGLSVSEARQFKLMMIGHSAGHAADQRMHPDITDWGTEVRQQFFNLQFAKAINSDHIIKEVNGFFDVLRENGIKYNW